MGNPPVLAWRGPFLALLFVAAVEFRRYSVFVHRYNFRIDGNILRNVSKIPRQLIAVRI
jgi:hypothetical protein